MFGALARVSGTAGTGSIAGNSFRTLSCKKITSHLNSSASVSTTCTLQKLPLHQNKKHQHQQELKLIRQIGGCGLTYRNFHTQQSHPTSSPFFSPKDEITFWGRTLRRLGFTSIPKSLLKQAGVLIYMKAVDELDYVNFFHQCQLPDTFASWFLVIELHAWLFSARFMQDGDEGQIVRNAFLKGMWEDVEKRSKRLEGALTSARKQSLELLYQQFNAAIIGYDEGLLGDDHVLAGALWRKFIQPYSGTGFSPELFQNPDSHDTILQQVKIIELLVLYVRTQYLMLNNLSKEQLLRKRAFKFATFNDSLFELADKMEKASGGAGVRQAVKISNR